MTDYRERLAGEIRSALGEHNDDDLPVVALVERLRTEVAALLVDADRYRWLRDTAAYVGINPHAKTCLWTLRGVYEIQGQGFGEAIDAARKEQK